MATVEDYPFDPSYLDPAEYLKLRGLDKLRGVSDRNIARELFSMYHFAQKNETDPRFLREQQVKEERARAEHDKWTAGVLRRALAKHFGDDAKDMAEHVNAASPGERMAFCRALADLRRRQGYPLPLKEGTPR